MALLTVIILSATFLLRNQYELKVRIGIISWVSLSAYFVIEYIVIQANTAPYNLFKQPMSDLGVTACGKGTYSLADYAICSPYHLLMNWTFTLTGIVIIVGAVFLQRYWSNKGQSKTVTVLFVIFGLSYIISGIFPADVNFLLHTLGSLPGMVAQIPALILIGLAIRTNMPKLSVWTFFSAFLTTSSLILLFFQPIFDLPGGLLQRMLYGFVWLWMVVIGIVLWKKKIKNDG